MAYRGSYNSFGGFHITPWVKRLLIANGVVFLATAGLFGQSALLPLDWLAFQPKLVLLRPWTLLTYMFVHGGFWHLFFNLLVLFFFGPPLEERWGSRGFIKYYLICGMGGAVLSFVFAINSAVIGASAAVYGVMLAFAMNWPDVPIYVLGIFPVKAKWMVAILAVFALFSAASGARDGVAHFAHLGGFAAGWIYLKLDFRTNRTWNKLKRMVNRPKLTVVSGMPQPEKPRPRSPVDERAYDDVDKVLDKISTKGMASLTPEERKLLDDVSRKYRQN
jgi:membrane associated rhomboid family serine protease